MKVKQDRIIKVKRQERRQCISSDYRQENERTRHLLNRNHNGPGLWNSVLGEKKNCPKLKAFLNELEYFQIIVNISLCEAHLLYTCQP